MPDFMCRNFASGLQSAQSILHVLCLFLTLLKLFIVFHIGTLMYIECRDDCLCSHECALFQCASKANAICIDQIHLQRLFGCAFKQVHYHS